MRIIAGAARGRRLRVPAGVRPTADRVREALFSSIQDRVAGTSVLDLFCGAGGLGLEAASRGAHRVVLVERDRRVLEALRSNVEAVGAPGVEVVAGDVVKVLADGGVHGEFDIVFVDPPYATDGRFVDRVLATVDAFVATGGIVIVERDRRSQAPHWPAQLRDEGSRRYGDTVLHRAIKEQR